MSTIDQALAKLPPKHRSALEWFAKNAGTVQRWPAPLPDGTLLATKAKGIYKPNWTDYALSVRQSLTGPYPDKPPTTRSDGTWSYEYFQENTDPTEGNREFTNKALVACMKDEVPVGVMLQMKSSPNPQYEVLGLAFVSAWRNGYFFFEGLSKAGFSSRVARQIELDGMLTNEENDLLAKAAFDPKTIADARKRIIASIIQRRGQSQFRKALIQVYGGKCTICGCSVLETLEAAHIVPYRGETTNAKENGLLLRSDFHALFDLGLITIASNSMTVVLAPDLMRTEYGPYHGISISLPQNKRDQPNNAALDEHRKWAGL
jgi:putative restriction endonuclease